MVTFDSLGRDDVIDIAATLESRSEHPLAEAIIAASNGRRTNNTMTGFESVTGMGVRGTIAGKAYRLGNLKMFDNGMVTPDVKAAVERFQKNATTPVILGDDREVLAVIGIADEMRAASKDIVGLLHRAGVEKVVMLTGDNDKTAKAIADRIGLDGYYADLLPQDKAAKIDAIRQEHGNVVMVGDGVNDAPALARANVGVAMGTTGSGTALETADVALMSDDLSKIEYVMRLGRRTIGIIKQNIAFSTGIFSACSPRRAST